MTKREHVIAALAGREVDRVPLAFWCPTSRARTRPARSRLKRFAWGGRSTGTISSPSRARSASRRCGVSRIVRRPNVRHRTRSGDIRRGAPPTSRALRR